MKNTRKSLPALKAEIDEHCQHIGKTFVHTKTGEAYNLLFFAFHEKTNEITAVYVLCALPWLKFTRPVKEFLEKFEERGLMK